MWERVIPIRSNIFERVHAFLIKKGGVQYTHDISEEIQLYYSRDLSLRSKPHLQFTAAELKQGERLLVKMGIPQNAKFFCLLVRDEAFHPKCTQRNTARNADIDNYKKAALLLANNGYYVVRMGKAVKKGFDIKHNKIIDYATSQYRSDFMDIYLSAHCHCFMTSGAGLDVIAHIFRRPILLINAIIEGCFHVYYPVELFLAKKIIQSKTGKLLSFKEQIKIFNVSSISYFNEMVDKHGLKVLENSADEIYEATKEMMLRMQGVWQDTEESLAAQQTFRSVMPLETYYYCHDGQIKTIKLNDDIAKYCTYDLLQNKALLADVE